MNEKDEWIYVFEPDLQLIFYVKYETKAWGNGDGVCLCVWMGVLAFLYLVLAKLPLHAWWIQNVYAFKSHSHVEKLTTAVKVFYNVRSFYTMSPLFFFICILLSINFLLTYRKPKLIYVLFKYACHFFLSIVGLWIILHVYICWLHRIVF